MRNLQIIPCILLLVSCNYSKQLPDSDFDDTMKVCTIVEESFKTSAIRSFLNTNTETREITDLFLGDSSDYAFLSYMNGNVLLSTFNNGFYKTISDSSEFSTDTLSYKYLEPYSKLDTVYKLVCPNDLVILCSNEGFDAFWIKHKGQLKFTYYSTKCGIHCLKESDQQKIKPLYTLTHLLRKAS